MVDLYLLRHAEAGDAPRDEDRVLTNHGQTQARAVAEGIARLNLELSAILSSPLARAAQTALPVSRAVGVPIETAAGLVAGCAVEDALALLKGRVGPVLLVGHEPQLSGIIAATTGGRVHMRKAMLAWIELDEIDPPQGALAWLLAWKHLARVGQK